MKFTEAVYRHPSGIERVYFCDANQDTETVTYRARAWLREDPRNEGMDEREFEFVGFRSPKGPTDVAPAARPGLQVLPGGRGKAIEW